MASIHADVTLVGGGIMSATLAMLIHRLDPALHICMIEQLPDIALESSGALNNAGTGHAGYCELNYTPHDKDGNVLIQRALEINAAFEVSLQFWSHLVNADRENITPSSFINRVPHLSAVWGQKDIDFLKARYTLLKSHHLFSEMKWSEDEQTLADWMPLMMKGRQAEPKLAATRVEHGADVNFGALTRILVSYLQKNANFELLTNTRVVDLHRAHGAKNLGRLKSKIRIALQNKPSKAPLYFWVPVALPCICCKIQVLKKRPVTVGFLSVDNG